ncbi:hypothetical protein Ancab_029955 [Ancistrocladus abbreviatus]
MAAKIAQNWHNAMNPSRDSGDKSGYLGCGSSNHGMEGKLWKARKIFYSVYLSLLSEHLGLRGGGLSPIYDPVVDSTYNDTWMAIVKSFTKTICCPVEDKFGHTTTDPGVAPKKLES